MKRRSLILGGLVGAAAASWLLRPTDKGHAHNEYFAQLSKALASSGVAVPTLVVDRSVLRANVATLKRHVADRFDYRIVAKSLPSLPLLEEVMRASGSQRLMLFHQPFINQVVQQFPQVDILLGKPMPVAAAASFYREFKDGVFQPQRQLRWLLDTPERVAQYDQLATQLQQDMRVCIELDVGLHRGGVHSEEQLLAMLDLMRASPRLNFCGFMGYEPHVVKVPVGNPVDYRDQAMAIYRRYVEVARKHLGEEWPADVLLNAAGSPTYQMYDSGDFPCNELAAGSCLVKPSDFDLSTLADHRPASFIATPVLKSLDTLEIPGIDLGGMQALWNPNRARTFFTYGGYWKAQPVSPRGLSYNTLFGRSTNQEMLNGSRSIDLQADDWVFLRPTQSEFVFLQFGDIAVYEQGRIVERWPVFSQQSA